MIRLAPLLLSAFALTAAQAAEATCEYPPQVTVPNGSTATDAEMKAANQAVKQYMAAVESYLACMDEEEKALGDSVTDEQKKVHTARHNAAVDALNAVAGRYNEQLQVFKKKNAK